MAADLNNHNAASEEKVIELRRRHHYWNKGSLRIPSTDCWNGSFNEPMTIYHDVAGVRLQFLELETLKLKPEISENRAVS